MLDWLWKPWPWFVVGPLIGAMVPVLLLLGNRQFGMSSNLRHLCAVCLPRKPEFFRYDWRNTGRWNLILMAGVVLGGFLGGVVFRNPEPVAISEATRHDLEALGLGGHPDLLPPEIFSWDNLAGLPGLLILGLGGLLVGFGTAYAGGCTSGHGVTGLADRQPASLLAVIGFFIGGLAGTFWILPVLVRGLVR